MQVVRIRHSSELLRLVLRKLIPASAICGMAADALYAESVELYCTRSSATNLSGDVVQAGGLATEHDWIAFDREQSFLFVRRDRDPKWMNLSGQFKIAGPGLIFTASFKGEDPAALSYYVEPASGTYSVTSGAQLNGGLSQNVGRCSVIQDRLWG